MLTHFKGLRSLSKASYEEFIDLGLKKYDIRQIRAVLELGKKYAAQAPKVKEVHSTEDCRKLLVPLMQGLDQEVIRCILLDERNKVLDIPLITVGTLSSCHVDAREIFKKAIRQNAYAIIMAHQHPSGDPQPSVPDIEMTKRIKKASVILGVQLLDHIIIGAGDRYYSFYESRQI